MTGVVAHLVLDRGFGFIGRTTGGPDLFFHFRDLVDLEFTQQLLGRRVQFDTEIVHGRERAIRVESVTD